jgi:hypothetical protein
MAAPTFWDSGEAPRTRPSRSSATRSAPYRNLSTADRSRRIPTRGYGPRPGGQLTANQATLVLAGTALFKWIVNDPDVPVTIVTPCTNTPATLP